MNYQPQIDINRPEIDEEQRLPPRSRSQIEALNRSQHAHANRIGNRANDRFVKELSELLCNIFFIFLLNIGDEGFKKSSWQMVLE